MLPLAYTARFVGCPITSCAASIAPILTTTWRVSLVPIASIAIAELSKEKNYKWLNIIQLSQTHDKIITRVTPSNTEDE